MLEQHKTIMNAILSQLQLLNNNPPHESQNNSKDSDEGVSRLKSKDKNIRAPRTKKKMLAPIQLGMPQRTRC